MRRALFLLLMICAVSSCWAESRQYAARPEAEYFVAAYAQHYRVPVPLVRAIVKRESDWRVCAVSPKGAVGLMQLMPMNCRALASPGPLQYRSKRLRWCALPCMADAAVSWRSQARSCRLLCRRTRDRQARTGVSQSGRSSRMCRESERLIFAKSNPQPSLRKTLRKEICDENLFAVWCI